MHVCQQHAIDMDCIKGIPILKEGFITIGPEDISIKRIDARTEDVTQFQ